MTKLIVMIPAYNEEQQVGNVIKEIPRNLVDETEIVVINDGSRDLTKDVAKKAGAQVVSFAGNRGLVSAFNAGLKYALSQKADIIVNIDADGQQNPDDIGRLIKPILEGKADVVIGSRFLTKKNHKSTIKYFGNIMFSKLISVMIRKRITDAQSGFRAFTREVAERLYIRKGKTYTQQMIIQADYYHFKIVEIPIVVRERLHGKSRLIKSPFSFAYRAGNLLMSVFAVYYPLKFFGSTGFILILLGLLIGLTNTRNLLATLIILIGMQCIFFGILFEILRKKE